MNAPIPIQEFGVAALAQLIRASLVRSVADNLPGRGGLLRVRGRLSRVRADQAYKTAYDIKLSDGNEEIQLEIPTELLRRHGLAGGETVIACGILKADCSRFTDHRVAIRLEVSELMAADPVQQDVPGTVRAATVESLKGLAVRRHPFPTRTPIRLSVVHSRSGQAMVDQDFLHEIDRLGNQILLERIPVNMLSAADIAAGVARATGDVVAVIRGGGDDSQFEVFDMLPVLEAFASKPAYRVVGLGHTANRTLLDLFAEFSANTPTHAGVHIRELVDHAAVEVPAAIHQTADGDSREGTATTAAASAPDAGVEGRDRLIEQQKAELQALRRRRFGRAIMTHGFAALLGAFGLVVLIKVLRHWW